MSAEERDYGKLAQTPAADRDRNGYHANHDYEQDHHIGKRQSEALRASEQPNDDNGECLDDTSNTQDHGPLRSEQDTMDVGGQGCKPAGVSPPSKRRSDFRYEQEAQRASEDQRAVHDEYHIAVSAQRSKAGRKQQHDKPQHNQQTNPYRAIDHDARHCSAPITAKPNEKPSAHPLARHIRQDLSEEQPDSGRG